MLSASEREELRELRIQGAKLRQLLLGQEEFEVLSFIRTHDWDGLEQWARERRAQDARGGRSATLLTIGRDGGGGVA